MNENDLNDMEEERMVELKPCPFCGSTDIDDMPKIGIYCVDCECRVIDTDINQEDRWNTRPIENQLRELLAEWLGLWDNEGLDLTMEQEERMLERTREALK